MASSGTAPAWLNTCLAGNKTWSEKISQSDPELLPKLSTGQSPEILWLGCSDSRVPETTVLGMKPGDVFVHRNIANVLTSTDLSSVSVIEYAVKYLKVKHIVLCGHTSCGGAGAALGNNALGKIDTWLTPLRRLRMQNAKALAALPDDAARNKLLVELNVKQGLEVLRENPDVIQAIKEGRLDVVGVVYDLAKGQLYHVQEDEDALAADRKSAFETS